jgi:formyltetrahydrofolate deformylase
VPQLLSSSEENGAGAVGTTGVLLVQCPDAKGVVAALAQLLFGFNCNILQSDQFSDETLAPSRFFQRIHFDFKDISVGTGNLAVLETAVADLAKRYQMDWKVGQLAYQLFVCSSCLYAAAVRVQQVSVCSSCW